MFSLSVRFWLVVFGHHSFTGLFISMGNFFDACFGRWEFRTSQYGATVFSNYYLQDQEHAAAMTDQRIREREREEFLMVSRALKRTDEYPAIMQARLERGETAVSYS
jgi:hypothetical protein